MIGNLLEYLNLLNLTLKSLGFGVAYFVVVAANAP
jgi:hypothetical protein